MRMVQSLARVLGGKSAAMVDGPKGFDASWSPFAFTSPFRVGIILGSPIGQQALGSLAKPLVRIGQFHDELCVRIFLEVKSLMGLASLACIR